ncbi:MAG: hypothetical protein IT327_19000 [Anaerolineae bacterium]|nr:hypothetical protein [Anaerolineae bacterium]
MKRTQKMLFVLANGYILLFFSEMMFWGHMALKDLPMTLLAYSTIGFVFLTAVSHFRIQEKWGLFLAGALFGWLAEGVLVQTTYEELPLSLSFTGLAWHALLTIWLGWYWLPQSLRQGSAWQVVRRAGATGGLFGLWLLMWQVEVHPAQPPTPGSFVWFALFSSVGLGVSYWLLHRLEGARFQASRREFTAVACLLLLYFAIQTVPTTPVALLVLPLLLLLLIVPLKKARSEDGRSLLTEIAGPLALPNLLALAALPASAIVTFSVATWLQIPPYSHYVLYAITTPLGFILLGMSIVKQWRRKSRETAVTHPSTLPVNSLPFEHE